MTPITRRVQGIATHPEDDLVVAAAISADIDNLISGDTQLQRLEIHEGVTIRLIIQIQFAAQSHARAGPGKRPAGPSLYQQSLRPLPDAPEAFGYIEGGLPLSSSLRVRSFWRGLISVGTSTVAVSQRTLGLRRK